MEIERDQLVHENGCKTSLRLRVVKKTKSSGKKYELLTREVSEGPFQREPVLSDPNDFEDEDNLIKVSVQGLWCNSHITDNSLIHLVHPKYDSATQTYIIDNMVGLLVIEPDNLLTCTAVASSLWCERKTWLNNVFLGQVGSNRAMLVGTLVHEVFQHGVKNKIVDVEKLAAFLDNLLDDATIMLEIYSVELHIKDIRNEAISYIGSVKEWIEKYMLAGPAQPLTNDANTEIKITKVADIEENVWSTKYGLKGKIDVTGHVRVYDKKTRTSKDKILPLELKTGNPKLSASHEAQVSLYSMMIEDRYAEYNQGLVIYLKNEAAMHNVILNHHIKRDLIQRRNELNYFMKSYYFGPEFLNQQRTCGNCERQTECILMSNIYDHDIDRFNCMVEMEKDATGHLDGKFIRFFQKYHEKLVTLVTKTDKLDNRGPNGDMNTVDSFWTYSSSEAEARGTGFGKLQATILVDPKTQLIRFTRHPHHKENILSDEEVKRTNLQPPSAKKQRIEDYFKPKKVDQTRYKPFNTGANFARYRIAISRDEDSASMDSQNSTTAMAIGFMQDLKEDQIVLKVYEGALDFIKPDRMYRLDRIEKKTNVDIERIVLVRLLTKEDWRCDRIRQLILEEKFVPKENIDLNLFITSAGFQELDELSPKHQNQVVEAISTDNYYIFNELTISDRDKIHQLVSVLTRVICQLDRKVLIVAQNIDHLIDLMRRLQKKTRFIIIDDGKSTKARFQYASNLVKVPQDDFLSLEKKFDSYIRQNEIAPVVMTTYAMSIGGLLFTRRTFEYCIAYDCCDTELLVGLSPMFCSDRHIMIDVKGASECEKALSTHDISLGDHLRRLRPPTKKQETIVIE